MIDSNEFFREATLLICGDLELHRALHSTLLYLRRYIPMDTVIAEYFDPALGAARTIARADVDGGSEYDVITVLPPEERTPDVYEPGVGLQEAMIINRPAGDPYITKMLGIHGIDPHAVSLIAIKLVEEEHGMFGGLVGFCNRPDAFSEEHARLMSMLAAPFSVAMVNALQHRDLMRHKERLVDDNRYLHRELRQAAGKEIIGGDFGLKPVMDMVEHVAATDSPVLLLGETGVGKDVIAGAIHHSSMRREGPYIAVNSGAIPDTLIDSELFGHEKGAFSGALAMKRGRFERAHEGTIFLDEIGELPARAQVRMLRVLQEKEIERVGGSKTIPVDIRVIAATNRNLEQMVEDGTFRKDLWFRLNVFPILIPPLRERRSDIPALAVHFVERKAREMRLRSVPALAPGAGDALMAYGWPGNVRELENVVERALIMNPTGPLRFDSLLGVGRETPALSDDPDDLNMNAAMASHIRRVLELSGGKVQGKGGAAEMLGMNPSTLRARMRKFGISGR